MEVARKVEARLAEIGAERQELRFRPIFSLVAFTESSFLATLSNFVEGAALTILVVFLFLRDGRATLIAAIAIPLSILPTFLMMNWLGFSLNSVTLLAISLVTGVLVDDAIVEIENIHQHMGEGRTPFDASLVAAEEIGLAVVATTLVICAVFVPVSFMPGMAGQFFLQFGLTVAIAAFFSLVVARLLTPMLAASGGSVPLSAVADIRYASGPTTIQRHDRQRRITLEVNLNDVPLGVALEKIQALPALRQMPADVRMQSAGDAEIMEELFASFGQAMGAGLLMVYAIQVLLYRDWIQPVTRMAALPLSIGGAFILLVLTGTSFSMPALIGT